MADKTYSLGIDIGSTTSKCVLLNEYGNIAARSLVRAGTGTDGPQMAFDRIFNDTGIERSAVSFIMATGYGRRNFRAADGEMSELSCHAKGVHRILPDVHTIIDIGGQDAKVILMGDAGTISDFVMNDKCAAGTGRFLDVMASILQLDITDLETYALSAKDPVRISSTCTVFAESEVISQLSANVPIPDLVAGICSSVAIRVGSLAKRIGIKEKVAMSGGVAKNGGVRRALSDELGMEIAYTDDAQYMGALGAAIAAKEKQEKI